MTTPSDIQRSASLSPCRSYRYRLRREWPATRETPLAAEGQEAGEVIAVQVASTPEEDGRG